MEKRILLSFALSLAVLLAFSWLSPPPAPDPNVPEVTTPVQTPAELPDDADTFPTTPLTTVGEAELFPAQTESVGVAPPELVGEVIAEFVREILVETLRYEARLNNEGARLESIRLRGYDDESGEMLELVDREAGAIVGWPLAITTGDAATDEAIQTARFVARRNGNNVRFEFASEGLQVVKEFRFHPEGHGIEVEADVRRDGTAVPFSLTWQGEFGDQSIDYQPALTNVVYMEGGEFERLNVGRIDDSDGVGPTTYVGVEDQFFMAMFLLPGGGLPRVSTTAINPGAEDVVSPPRVEIEYPGVPVALYVGPKQQDHLRVIDANLPGVIDYGFFEIIVRPLLLGLLWIHGYVGNFGWAIIILTFFINFALMPVRLWQQLSMLKMQKIQPQMRTLQDKIKKVKSNDPRRQELQAEMMGLYKKHGVNPLGGCLPLLVQMPFLFAFFSLLRSSIELRGAPWLPFYIQDLSKPDPLVILLPGLMGLSMYVMQKMTPMTGDPMQARMMMMMPLVLPIMLIRMQSGLMLYWLTSNVLGAGFQYFIKKRYGEQFKKGKQAQAIEAPPPAKEVEVISEPSAAASSGEPKQPKRRRRHRRK